MEFLSVIPLVNLSVIKKIITEGYTDDMKRVILFFLFPTDLPMDKKLPMKDSSTKHFRR
jgi:hypothetical protein